MGQEIFNPSVFFYEAAAKATLPFDVLGLVAVQFLLMHWVEVRRWRDLVKPGSVDTDPIFAGNALPPHEVGYPGGIFDPLCVSRLACAAQLLAAHPLTRLHACFVNLQGLREAGGDQGAEAEGDQERPARDARVRGLHHGGADDGQGPAGQPG